MHGLMVSIGWYLASGVVAGACRDCALEIAVGSKKWLAKLAASMSGVFYVALLQALFGSGGVYGPTFCIWHYVISLYLYIIYIDICRGPN